MREQYQTIYALAQLKIPARYFANLVQSNGAESQIFSIPITSNAPGWLVSDKISKIVELKNPKNGRNLIILHYAGHRSEDKSQIFRTRIPIPFF